MRNKLAFLIIIIGLLIALFPIADRIYTWYWQNKALQSYEELNVILAEEQNPEDETIIIEEEEVPLGSLPKTSEVSPMLFYGVGAFVTAVGAKLRKK
ncbi:MAG: hypothetical protein PHG06_17190 [Parabacteroides sp.]|nr:hypothetical protein [Parabacteroides sp.]